METIKINTEFLDITPYKQNRLLDIKYIIIHHTAWSFNGDFNTFIWKWRKDISIHYYITKKGEIFQFVNDNKIAYHTWPSNIWPKETISGWWWNINPISLWIELENKGDLKDNYTTEQIKKLEELTLYLINKYNISEDNVLWHKEITTRKIDPSHNFYVWDMKWFRQFLKNNKKNMEKETKKYENIEWFEIFWDMIDNYELKKLIEIWLYRYEQNKIEWKLKIRK